MIGLPERLDGNVRVDFFFFHNHAGFKRFSPTATNEVSQSGHNDRQVMITAHIRQAGSLDGYHSDPGGSTMRTEGNNVLRDCLTN